MLGLLPLSPAYGRDYASAAAVLADFLADKDFACASGSYTNRADLLQLLRAGASIEIRYSARRRACVFKLGQEPQPRKRAPRRVLSTGEARCELAAASASARAAETALRAFWDRVRASAAAREGREEAPQARTARERERKRLEAALAKARAAERRAARALEKAQGNALALALAEEERAQGALRAFWARKTASIGGNNAAESLAEMRKLEQALENARAAVSSLKG